MACFSVECKAMTLLPGKLEMIFIENKKEIYYLT